MLLKRMLAVLLSVFIIHSPTDASPKPGCSQRPLRFKNPPASAKHADTGPKAVIRRAKVTPVEKSPQDSGIESNHAIEGVLYTQCDDCG